jgi:methylglutaconyl-CoA hydratase
MIELLGQHLDTLRAQARIRVIVVTGAGRFFSTGMDLGMSNQHAMRSGIQARSAAFLRLCSTLQCYPKPIVCVLNGPAIGGGAGIAFCCDVRLASPTA